MSVPAVAGSFPQMSSCPRVAYFCMEYGLDTSFPIYAGGLGILAGDHMKSVGDLHAPVTGVGLFWDEGYTRQIIATGHAIEDQYRRPPRDALRRVDARVEVAVRGKKIPLRAWKVDRFISSTLYLLEPEREEDRWITQRLYGGGAEDRIAQEILLGVGGVRLLEKLGLPVDVYHFNEGHAVFAGLELLRANKFGGTSLTERVASLRPHVVFTTHTPVPAGNEVHDLALIRKLEADLGLPTPSSRIGADPLPLIVAVGVGSHRDGFADPCRPRARCEDVDGARRSLDTTGRDTHLQAARIRAAWSPNVRSVGSRAVDSTRR